MLKLHARKLLSCLMYNSVYPTGSHCKFVKLSEIDAENCQCKRNFDTKPQVVIGFTYAVPF